mmetsp:Transcript_37806/g.72450  ORF Transcript_37806/g.72450 Transcript_37806/m.72450 type:complete len:223 (-) Transcript_37806:696-1364(-)
MHPIILAISFFERYLPTTFQQASLTSSVHSTKRASAVAHAGRATCMLTTLASAVRNATEASRLGPLRAALVLAPSATAVRHTERRLAAACGLCASLVLAAVPAPVSDAEAGARARWFTAPVPLAPFASAVVRAERRAAASSRLAAPVVSASPPSVHHAAPALVHGELCTALVEASVPAAVGRAERRASVVRLVAALVLAALAAAVCKALPGPVGGEPRAPVA